VTTRAALLREVHVHPELEAGGQVPAAPGRL
jgi:hypothetical protein